MKGSNDSMMLRGADAPALGARSGGCVQADPAAVQRRIPVADPRGSRPLHPARRDRPSAASRGYCHVNYPERKEIVNAFPSGTRHLLEHVKCFGSE